MFPSLKQAQLQQGAMNQHGITLNQTNQQKKKKRRQRWNGSKYILLDATIPTEVNQATNKKIKKTHKIQIYYIDDKNKKRSKTVFFGTKQDYIHHHDNVKRLRLLSRLSHKQDPFHPNYYRALLANRKPTMRQAYVTFMRQLTDLREKMMSR